MKQCVDYEEQYSRLILTSGLLKTPKLGFSRTNSICGGGGNCEIRHKHSIRNRKKEKGLMYKSLKKEAASNYYREDVNGSREKGNKHPS